MATFREWIARLCGTLGRRRGDADLEDELRSHLALADETAATAPAPGGALGRRGVTPTMDALRDQRGLPWLDDLFGDLRYGGRLLRADLVFTGVAVVSLAIGIGATSAVFSLADTIILRPLPVPDPGAVMTVTADAAEEGGGGFMSYPAICGTNPNRSTG